MSKSNPVYEALVAGRELISVEERWTKGYLARTRSNDNVWPESPAAVCWCSSGAVSKVLADRNQYDMFLPVCRALDEALIAKGIKMSLPSANDWHNHAEVLSIWDKAIELTPKEI